MRVALHTVSVRNDDDNHQSYHKELHRLRPIFLQFFDTVGWVTGKASGLQKPCASNR